jgi:ankyrin repeat protein
LTNRWIVITIAMSSLDEQLCDVAGIGSLNVVKRLVQAGANVNSKNEYGWTPLHQASFGHAEVMRFLIENGANVHAKNKTDWTPLHLACHYCGPEAASFLVNKKPRCECQEQLGLDTFTFGL